MDEDGNPTPFRLTLNAGDVDGDVLTWTGTQPGHGQVMVTPGSAISASVTYTPATDYNGTDSFVAGVSDGELTDSIAVSVTVAPVNDAPVAQDDVAVAVRQENNGGTKILAPGPSGTLNVLQNDTDVEGSGLAVAGVGRPSQGGAVSVDVNGGLITYTPVADFTGTDPFTYTTSDGGLTDTAVVSLTVTDGMDGGTNGDTVVVDNTGTNDSFTLTIEIPAETQDGLALVYDEIGEEMSPPDGFAPAGTPFSLAPYLDGRLLDDGYVFQEPLTLTLAYANVKATDLVPGESSLALYFWDNDNWLGDGITVLERDTVHHRLVVSLNRAGEFGIFRREFLYFPLVMNSS